MNLCILYWLESSQTYLQKHQYIWSEVIKPSILAVKKKNGQLGYLLYKPDQSLQKYMKSERVMLVIDELKLQREGQVIGILACDLANEQT